MLCWARQLLIILVAILGISHMMAACGQKGPLVLPEDPAGKQETSRPSPVQTPRQDQTPEIPGPEAVPPPIR